MSGEFKHIVRVARKDLDGTRKVVQSIMGLKGIGNSLAQAVVSSLKIDNKMRLGSLSDQQISEIESRIKDLGSIGLPKWLLNRRKEIESGSSSHMIGADLEFAVRNDIERGRISGSWRGVRHSLGLKVRGQRTRTTGRKGRTIGVRKGLLVRPTGALGAPGAPAAAPASAPAATPASPKPPAGSKAR